MSVDEQNIWVKLTKLCNGDGCCWGGVGGFCQYRLAQVSNGRSPLTWLSDFGIWNNYFV